MWDGGCEIWEKAVFFKPQSTQRSPRGRGEEQNGITNFDGYVFRTKPQAFHLMRTRKSQRNNKPAAVQFI